MNSHPKKTTRASPEQPAGVAVPEEPSLLAVSRQRILIVSGEPIVRRGLAAVVAEDAGLEVCGEADGPAEALAQMRQSSPHVVVLDISLKHGCGIDLIERVRAKHKNLRVLALSNHDESLYAERAMRAGAVGYVSRCDRVETILDALRRVLSGETFLNGEMTNRLLHTMIGRGPVGQDPIKSLSNRELQVFELIGHGLTTRQIAERLNLSPKTIETHRDKAKTKLSLTNSTELNRRAIQWVLESS